MSPAWHASPAQKLSMFAVATAILIVLPHGLRDYYQVMVTQVMVWGLFAVSFDIVYGYTGMLSIGQALFFGGGAYGTALALLGWHTGVWVAIAVGVAVATVLAVASGILAIRVSGHSFVIITIIFSMMVYFIAQNLKEWTGGDDGIPISAPTLSLAVRTVSLTDPLVNYYFVLFFFLAAVAVVWRVVTSPVGYVFLAIKHNEERAALVGYSVRRYRLGAFVLGGVVAGLSGSLYALTFRHTSVHLLHWIISGKAVIWTLFGGAGTLLGPILGAAVLVPLEDFVSSTVHYSGIVVGLLLMLIVIVEPGGAVGLLRRAHEWLRPRPSA